MYNVNIKLIDLIMNKSKNEHKYKLENILDSHLKQSFINLFNKIHLKQIDGNILLLNDELTTEVNKNKEILVKLPGDVNGIDFKIKDLVDCTVFILDYTAQV